MAKREVKYGLRINCEAQGCDPKHDDDGEISPVMTRNGTVGKGKPKQRTVNGHAADLVQQVVTYSDWHSPTGPWACSLGGDCKHQTCGEAQDGILKARERLTAQIEALDARRKEVR